MTKKWFRKAVMRKPPYTLGWRKSLSARTRRSKALASRPKAWSLDRKRLSAARALTALANVTKDRRTKELARKDARHFYRLAKE